VHTWVGEVRSRVPDDEAASRVVRVVARVLELADAPGVRSRAEVAAQAVRWAHDLDRGGAFRRPVGLALALRSGTGHWDDPEVWAAAGLPGDLVATPVLTWALPLLGDGLAAARITTALSRWLDGEQPILAEAEQFQGTVRHVPLGAVRDVQLAV